MTAASAMGQPAVALPPVEAVAFDARGGFRVNGAPFFPILLYSGPFDEAVLAQLRAFRFNVLVCDPKYAESLPPKGFYGAVHVGAKEVENRSGAFLAVGVDSPALVFKEALLKQTRAANAKARDSIPGRPVMNAIGYWEDEPAGVFAGKLPTREKYEDLVAAIDVAAPYLYPVPYQPVASVGEAVARARKATDGAKPILAILQLFAWKKDDRYPTPAELRCMAFLALAEGAHGIGYFMYDGVNGHPKTTIAQHRPELWKSVGPLNEAIAEVGPRFVAGTASDDVAVNDKALVLRAVRDGRGGVAALVNPSPLAAKATLRWRDPAAARTATVDGRRLDGETVALEPFGVAIVRWSPTKGK